MYVILKAKSESSPSLAPTCNVTSTAPVALARNSTTVLPARAVQEREPVKLNKSNSKAPTFAFEFAVLSTVNGSPVISILPLPADDCVTLKAEHDT